MINLTSNNKTSPASRQYLTAFRNGYQLSKKTCQLITLLALLLAYPLHSLAAATTNQASKPSSSQSSSGSNLPEQSDHAWQVSYYYPSYILYYYTQSPYTAFYQNDGRTPGNNELKFQISFKVPLIYINNFALYAAYTQVSYWQAFSDSAWFRETNYMPELFARLGNQHRNADVGFAHQSNGRGGDEERSWNRVYGRLSFTDSQKRWSVHVMPWFAIKDSQLNKYNPNITDYLGYSCYAVSTKWPYFATPA